MEKIMFMPDDSEKPVAFYVLEQTKIGGVPYILVTDSEEGDAQCLILKDKSKSTEEDSLYEIVEDEVELQAVSKVFEELLEDIGIEM
nr:DUF1292 domain-containing protein [uncultured Sellimonas sp.]